MGGSGTQGGVKRQIGDAIFLGETRLDVTASFALCLGDGAATGFAAGQSVELGIETAGGKFLFRGNFLPTFPPLSILGCLGNGLGASLCLRDISPIFDFRL